MNHFATAAAFIDTARKAGEGVYVHCTAGISRSTAVVAGYLILALGLSDVDALGHIQRCRDTVCPNEGFREQLSQLSLQRDWPLREGSCGRTISARASASASSTRARLHHAVLQQAMHY